jgi:hypothetical protein
MIAHRQLVERQQIDADYLVALIDGVVLPAARAGRETRRR